MILEQWYVESVRAEGVTVEDTKHHGRFLRLRGDTPETLEANLRILAGRLEEAADRIAATHTRPECICGEINARHCPVHDGLGPAGGTEEPKPGKEGEGPCS